MGGQTSQKYREFTSSAEAQEWAFLHYADLLNIDRASEMFYTISTYTGSWYKALNGFLRVLPPYGTDDFAKINYSGYEDHLHDIKVIFGELIRHSLPENIVVFRFTKIRDLLNCSNSRFLHRGSYLSDKAFLSTTLVKDNLKEFSKMHRCTCLLKIFLPKGFPGAYVTFVEDQKLLNEQEFLLPPNVTFEITKIHLLSFPVLIECKAVSHKLMKCKGITVDRGRSWL